MMQVLITKRTPFKNHGLGSNGHWAHGSIGYHPKYPYYDEQRDHRIVEVDAKTLGNAAYLLGFSDRPQKTPKTYNGITFYMTYLPVEKCYHTLSLWTGEHRLGMIFPGILDIGQWKLMR